MDYFENNKKMATLSTSEACFNVGVNVCVTKRDKKTGRILQQEKGHNRCLKQTLLGIAKYLNGEFNPTAPLNNEYNVSYRLEDDWIPSYLGVGTNIAGAPVVGIGPEVTVNDTRLLNEISPRVRLPERNKLITRDSQAYVQLCIVTYLPDEWYVGESIGEAGLFAQETGNNCLFRIALKEPVIKDVDTIVEVNWTISIVSVDSKNSQYVELDKSDLRQSMERLLDRYQVIAADTTSVDISKSVSDFKIGIYDYYRSDITQESIDNDVAILEQDLKDLGGPV